MIKRELMKRPELAGESWDRFLPQFKKQNVKRKKKKPSNKKNEDEYNPFPKEQTPRKIDLELESGEYFNKQNEDKEDKKSKKAKNTATTTAKKFNEKELNNKANNASEEKIKPSQIRKEMKQQSFIAPDEALINSKKPGVENRVEPNLEELKAKFLAKKPKKTTK